MRLRTARIAGLLLVLLIILLPGQLTHAQSNQRVALVLTADGPLTPAMAEYLDRGLKAASQMNAELVILKINTPGGDINLMSRMATSIRGSQVPVVTYVSPQGAMAGSAGSIITLSGHVAAMAPETTIGAASPVGGQGQDLATTESTKIKEMTKAMVRSFSTQRPPAAVSLAQDMIDKASAVSDQEALQVGLIDFVAKNDNDLLRQLNGWTVTTNAGSVVLDTSNIRTETFTPTLIEQLLQMLTDPNIVFLLLALGVQALLIELAHPGGWIAGFVGVIALALATYGLGILPVNLFGLVFLVLAFVLFLLDIKAPTHGALTAAGLVSFVGGALILFNSPNVPTFQRVSVPLVVGTGMVSAAVFFTIVSIGIRAMHAPLRTGARPLIGKVGLVRNALNPVGTIQVSGELWTALVEEDQPVVPSGKKVLVLAMEGNRLLVRPAPEEDQVDL